MALSGRTVSGMAVEEVEEMGNGGVGMPFIDSGQRKLLFVGENEDSQPSNPTHLVAYAQCRLLETGSEASTAQYRKEEPSTQQVGQV